MNLFDDEDKIIDWLQTNCAIEKLVPYHGLEIEKRLIESICNKDQWKNHWINSAMKSDPPPDYYSDTLQLMMEVMRVDDHTREGKKKGKILNPVNARESIIQNEIRQKFSNVEHIVVNACTEFLGKDNHNYDYYRECFLRVVKKHIESIPIYRKNHPNCKLTFFVFDEASAYVEVMNEQFAAIPTRQGKALPPIRSLHHPFFDTSFMSVLKDTGVDYLIIYAPFKRFSNPKVNESFPTLIAADLSCLEWDSLYPYKSACMVSTEE